MNEEFPEYGSVRIFFPCKNKHSAMLVSIFPVYCPYTLYFFYGNIDLNAASEFESESISQFSSLFSLNQTQPLTLV